jgi:hypothetical protein
MPHPATVQTLKVTPGKATISLFADLAVCQAEQSELRDAQNMVGTGHDLIGKTSLANRNLGICEVGDGAIPQFAALEPLPLSVNRYDPSTCHGFGMKKMVHLHEAFFSAPSFAWPFIK